jgi:hypothetical protein
MSAPSDCQILSLSLRDRELIIAGLDWIVSSYNLYRTTGQFYYGRPDFSWNQNLNKGIFDQMLLERMLALHATFRSLRAGGRLRVETSMEIAACALAVRVAVTRHRHGHQKLNIAQVKTCSANLLRRLESARKRAKRSEVRQLGADGYQKAAHTWREFSTWLRVHHLDCRCKHKRRTPLTRTHRVLFNQFVEWARAGLIERKHKVPAEREFRKLISLSLRYVRRYRTRFSVRELWSDRIEASAHFANFIILYDEKVARRRQYE